MKKTILLFPLFLSACVTAAAPGSMHATVLRQPDPYTGKNRYYAVAPVCDEWGSGVATNFAGGTTGNYGCANRSNLSQMADRPTDLVRGHGKAGAAAEPSSRAVDQYRTGTTPNSGVTINVTGMSGL